MKVIGFATQFYTLWDITTEEEYFTDNYGNHWLKGIKTNYWYIQNISKDLAVVKAKYPDLKIDEELKGKTASWEKRSEDLTPHILKFGKYSGRSISEVVEIDFSYIIWLIENGRRETRLVCEELPQVVQYRAEIEKKRAEAMASHPVIENGEVEIAFTSNPNRLVGEDLTYDSDIHEAIKYYQKKCYAEATIGDGNQILVIFDEVKEVAGMYPYNMAIINGKAMRVKGKKMKLDLVVIKTKRFESYVKQIAIIK